MADFAGPRSARRTRATRPRTAGTGCGGLGAGRPRRPVDRSAVVSDVETTWATLSTTSAGTLGGEPGDGLDRWMRAGGMTAWSAVRWAVPGELAVSEERKLLPVHRRHQDRAVEVLVAPLARGLGQEQAGVARRPVQRRRPSLPGWCSAQSGSEEQSRIASNAWSRCRPSIVRLAQGDTSPPSVPSLSGAAV